VGFQRLLHTFLLPIPSISAGAFIGVNAAFISILTEWLSDLRRGYCSEGWWLNQEFCCWEIEEVNAEGACAAWIPWSNFTPGNWIVYVLLAVRFLFWISLAECSSQPVVPLFMAFCTPRE
jgi:H+/Cl- antiporter ClcA